MSRNVLFGGLLLASFTMAAQDHWSVKTTFAAKEAPNGIINASFEIGPKVAVNNRGTVFAFLNERFSGVWGNAANKAITVSYSGKKLAEVENIFPVTHEISQIVTDANGNFWIAGMEGERKGDTYPHAVIYELDSLLNKKFSLSLDSVFFPVALLPHSANQFYMTFIGYGPFEMFRKKFDKFKEWSQQLVRIDFNSNKVVSYQQLESTGGLLNDPAFFVLNKDSSFFLIQNTVILRGADHHDVHLYSFSKKGNLLTHRHLKGVGELTHLWVRQVEALDGNQLKIVGYSDDPVNFEKTDAFFRDKSKQITKGTILDNTDESNINYRFQATYDQKLKLISYLFSEEREPDTDPALEGTVLNGKFEIKFRNKPGELNTSQAPVFELYK